MELTSQDILERMEKFVEGARKIKELKDYLLTFRFLDRHEDWLQEELERHDEAIEAIGRIYTEEMLPLAEEMAAYLARHEEDLDDLIAAGY